MIAQQISTNDIVTLDDLRQLAGSIGPCVTIVTQIPTPFELSPRLKKAMRRVERELKDRRWDSTTIESLMEPISDLAVTAETAGLWGNALILFRSRDLFRYFLMYRRPPEVESVEDRFQVRPLLPVFARDQRYHLLGLNRGHIRLWHCRQHQAEEADIKSSVPQDMNVWLNTRQPDHVLDGRSAGGPSVGSMKGVTFGTNSDRDRENEYLAHFFKEVDKGVKTLLRNDTARLLLAGIDQEVAMFRRVSEYPRLFDRALPGIPDGMPIRELHERSMEAVMQARSEVLEKALADFEKQSNAGRVSSDAREIVKAAWEGRVADLFILENAALRGTWNEQLRQIETSNSREDLLNAAALETVRHGGRVFALESQDMPLPREVSATLRF
jgi:Bacterial archaeo-eukaryotic release factor family 3